ncbi:flagellar rod protein FlaI [Photobacterium sanctipauli]|uniref:Flagellar rod protein FlaI n=1 Tax=Photobacterium sanctipauli TaxID=1342794 RepID=A0A2T3NTH6_9GAMM|nr:flagellar rod protein FlaI [Photobacterium sanctipauli]PSW19549.1 flagellar rod protein FlaI [Photobacterium sanctipauli]
MKKLEQIDQQLEWVLAASDDVDSVQLQQLLEQRELVLQQLMAEPDKLEKQRWQQAIERTSGILERIRQHRERSAAQVQRLQHGQRSMQVYNKFR